MAFTSSRRSATSATRRKTRSTTNSTLNQLIHSTDDNSTIRDKYDHLNLSPPPSATKENLDFWDHIVNRRTTQLARFDLKSLESVRDGIIQLLGTSNKNDADDDDGGSKDSTTPNEFVSTELLKQLTILSNNDVNDDDSNTTIKEQYVAVVRKFLVCHFYTSVDTRIDRSERLQSLHRMKEILNCLDMANANTAANMIAR